MLVLIDHTLYRFKDSVKGNIKEKMIPTVVGKPPAETALKGDDWFAEVALGHKKQLIDNFVSGVSGPLDHIKRITLKTIIGIFQINLMERCRNRREWSTIKPWLLVGYWEFSNTFPSCATPKQMG